MVTTMQVGVAFVVAFIGFFGVVFGALWQRVNAVEIRADRLQEALDLSQRDLIDAKEAEMSARREAEAAIARVDELEDRLAKIEHAFDELLKRTRMSSDERDRLRSLYRTGGLVFSTKELVN